MRASILLLAAALWCGIANALLPHQINYQGYLTNPGGTPVNASVPMVLKLYNDPVGGVALYSETQTVTVTNGVFDVLIGSVTPLPLPFDVPYYLGITVGADQEMTPRRAVAASPYAIRSATTESLAVTATVPATQITGVISSAMTGTGAAQFVRTIQAPNNSVPPGAAFTIDTQVFNSVPAAIVAAAGNGGTVFTLNTPGTYVLDYEMSLDGAGSVGIYKGPEPGALALDTNSLAGSTAATTWIHGRTLVVVAGSPVVVEVSPAVGVASVGIAGTAAGFYLIRLTILKIS